MKKKIYYVCLSIIIVFILLLVVINRIVAHFYDENIPILAYHVISDYPMNEMEVSTSNFERQMKFLHDFHFRVLSLEEVENYKLGKVKIKGRKVAITFDDGSESYYLKAVPILKRYHFHSTNFVITSKLNTAGYLSTEEYEELKNDDLVDLQSHSHSLHNREHAKCNDYREYYDDLNKNRDYNYKYYAYPFGISNSEYIKALKDNNIQMAFKYAPSKWLNVHDDNYVLPRVPIYNSTSFFKFILKLLIKR